MTEDPMSVEIVPRDEDGEVVATRVDTHTLLRVSSRFGVWGFVGGLGAMTALTLGAPISLELAFILMGTGVFVSGLGTLTASFLAYQRLAQRGGLMKVASLFGIPLGGLLAVLGLTSLFQWPVLVGIVNAITPATAVVGTVVIILLVVGFFLQWLRDGDDESAT